MAHSLLYRKLVHAMQTARRQMCIEKNIPLPIPMDSSHWSRRKFIKTSAVVGAAGVAMGSLSFPNLAEAGGEQPKIAIIGAGIAGLNAAYQLKKAGLTSTIYEGRNRIGGRMQSIKLKNGVTADIGGELVNTDHADMHALIEDFGIQLFNRIDDAQRVPFPETVYLFDNRAISEAQVAEDVRELVEQLAADAALLDQDFDKYGPLFDRLSVKDYLEQHSDKITQPYIAELFKDAIRSEYGVEQEESSALQLIFLLPVVDGQNFDLLGYSDEVFTVVGGSAQITDALGEALSGQIELNKKLTAIKKYRKFFLLTFSDGSQAIADVVVMAMPFPLIKEVKLDVPLPRLLRLFIKEAGLGKNEKVIAGFKNRFWRKAGGFSLEAWSDLGFVEVWDESQRHPELKAGNLNFFLGGKQVQNQNNPETIVSLGHQFVRRINRFVPGAIDAFTGDVTGSNWANSPFTRGAYANFKPGQLTRFSSLFWVESDDPNERQEVNAGNLYFIGEFLSDAFYGFMNGGAETGRLAANAILAKSVLGAKNV